MPKQESSSQHRPLTGLTSAKANAPENSGTRSPSSPRASLAKNFRGWKSTPTGYAGVVSRTTPHGRNSLKLTVISLPRDAVTKNRDFLITPHPHCKGLYLATGGSFHGWKFLPIIGQYVAQMLEGALEEDLSRRWSWDRAPDPDMPDYQKPKRDWKDLRDDDESRSWWFTRAISSVFGLFWK
jgi:hypothetical protein